MRAKWPCAQRGLPVLASSRVYKNPLPRLYILSALLLFTSLALAQAPETEPGTATAEVPGPAVEAIISESENLLDAGKHEAAIKLLEDGLEKSTQLDAVDRARLHIRLAFGYKYRGDFDGVRTHVDAALALVAPESRDDDDGNDAARSVYADALGTRAIYFSATRQLSKFLDASLAELDARRKLPQQESKLDVALINVGNAHILMGDYASAERYLEEALSFAQNENNRTNPRRVTTIRVNLGVVYSQRKEHLAAVRVWRKAIEYKREHAPGSVGLANVLASLGSALRVLERHEEAEEVLSEALAIQREQIPESQDIGRTLYTMGQIAESRGDLQRAERLYRETMAIMDANIPHAPDAAVSRRALAGLMIDQQRHEEARVLLDEAMTLTSLTNNPGKHASTLFLIGRLKITQDDRNAARRYWQAAIDALGVQYDILGGSALTLAGFSQAYQPLYRSLAQLHIDDGEYLEAIRLLESYRNRALLERIDVNRLLRQSEVGEQLLGDLGELQNRAREAVTPDAAAEAGNATPAERLAELRRQRRDRVGEAIRQQPQLAELLEDTESRDSNMRVPDADSRILFYSLGERRSDLLVVSAEGVVAHRLPPAAEIATLVERFRILVQRPEADPAPLADVTRRLHQILLAPAQAELTEARSLLIRADGPLLLLPFAALRDDNSAYLVERYRIQRLHTLNQARDAVNESDRADSSYSGFAFAGDGDGRPGIRGERAPLRHVGDEIARAAALFGDRAEQHIGTAATETRARRIDSRRILHFAGHAVADPVEPLSSYISLAADPHNDGQLELWEIMADLSLDGGLVVLSACETALGPSFAGEGLFGLAKGFAFAGADTVMASLWAIDDASTMHLTEAFYRDLAAGRPPAEALSRAQRAMLAGDLPAAGWLERLLGTGRQDDFRHPYYWAAFTLTATR